MTVGPVQVRDVPVEIRAPVELRPLEQADVGSKTLGYLDAVLVDRGDPVPQGAARRRWCARATCPTSWRRPADAGPDPGLDGPGARQRRARQQLAPTRRRLPAGAAARAVAALASAEAHARRGEGQRGRAGDAARRDAHHSPLDGVVSQRRLDPGALVGPPGAAAHPHRRAHRRAARVRPGQRARRRRAARRPGRRRRARRVSRQGASGARSCASPRRSTRSRAPLDAEVQLAEPPASSAPGMYGARRDRRSTIHPRRGRGPGRRGADHRDGQHYVFVLEGEKVQRAERRDRASMAATGWR